MLESGDPPHRDGLRKRYVKLLAFSSVVFTSLRNVGASRSRRIKDLRTGLLKRYSSSFGVEILSDELRGGKSLKAFSDFVLISVHWKQQWCSDREPLGRGPTCGSCVDLDSKKRKGLFPRLLR